MEWRNHAHSWAYFPEREVGERFNVMQMPQAASSSLENALFVRLAPIATLNMPSYQENHGATSIRRCVITPEQSLPRQWEPGLNVIETDANVSKRSIQVDRHEWTKDSPIKRKAPKRPKKHPTTRFEFISIHGPTGKREVSAHTKVRAHAMRRVHELRRASAATKNQGSLRLERFPTPDYVDIHSGSSPRPSKEILLISHVDMPAAQGPRSHLLVSCTQCGILQLATAPADNRMVLPHVITGPKSILGAGTLDPFASTPLAISHRMHELLHHCKSKNLTKYGA